VKPADRLPCALRTPRIRGAVRTLRNAVSSGRARCARYVGYASVMESNPYQAPAARLHDAPGERLDPETDRRMHLQRESGLRGVGVACFAFAALMSMNALVAKNASVGPLLLAALGAWTAWGYLRLRWWTRLPALALAMIVLFGSVLTAAPLVGFAAWLTWSKKGKRVLEPDYAYVRALTPGLRAWRRPAEAIGVLALCVAQILFFLAFFQLMQRIPF
jgi:hypothetical protein